MSIEDRDRNPDRLADHAGEPDLNRRETVEPGSGIVVGDSAPLRLAAAVGPSPSLLTYARLAHAARQRIINAVVLGDFVAPPAGDFK